MSRLRKESTPADERTRDAFEAHLWRAVESGSVVAMRLWCELHPDQFKRGEEAEVDLFSPVGDTENA